MKTGNRFFPLILPLTLGLVLTVFWLLGSQPPDARAQSGSGVVRVALTGNDVPGCGSAASPCRTVQYGVDQAVEGEEVLVATGVYTDVNNRGGPAQVVYLTKTLTIRGGYTTTNWATSFPLTQPTILDAQGQGRVMYITGIITPTIEGIHMTGGDASELDGEGGGVRIYQSAATIRDCWIYSNTADTVDTWGYWGWGGGVHLSSSDAILENNIIQGNIASTDYMGAGGGLSILYGNVELINNTIQNNIASTANDGYGGGIKLLNGTSTLIGNNILSNTASTAAWGYGGGIELSYCDSVSVIISNTIKGNIGSTADQGGGGGLELIECPAILQSNTIINNTGSVNGNGVGGGIEIFGGPYTVENNHILSNSATLNSQAKSSYGGGMAIGAMNYFTLTNNVIADNYAKVQGSGIWVYADYSYPSFGAFIHNTIADNRGNGGGVFGEDHITLALTNTIISGHSVGVAVDSTSVARLQATLWHNNGTDTIGGGTITLGSINLHGNPAFVDPAALDYHIKVGAAWNAGINAGVSTDIDGDPRPIYGGFDIGADEYTGTLHTVYLPLIRR